MHRVRTERNPRLHDQRALGDVQRPHHDPGVQLLHGNANLQSGPQRDLERLQHSRDPSLFELDDGLRWHAYMHQQCLECLCVYER